MLHPIALRDGIRDIAVGQEVKVIDRMSGIIGRFPRAFQTAQSRSADVAASAMLKNEHGLFLRCCIDLFKLGECIQCFPIHGSRRYKRKTRIPRMIINDMRVVRQLRSVS